MASCEFCGKKNVQLFTVEVAGSRAKACSDCKHLGKVVEEPVKNMNTQFNKNMKGSYSQHSNDNTNRISKTKTSLVLELVPNYTSIIHSALAKKNMNLHQLARVLNIKESTLNKYFSGKIQPDENIAKKLERFFEISILKESEDIESTKISLQDNMLESDENVELSLGDLLQKELKKKNLKLNKN